MERIWTIRTNRDILEAGRFDIFANRRSAKGGNMENRSIEEIITAAKEAHERKAFKEEAAIWQEGADLGDAYGQLRLGECYEKGIGVKRDYEKAFGWYSKSADQNHLGAQYCLGFFYQKGYFVKKDHAKAIFWYAKSAEQNMPFAQYELARYYEKGKVVPRDLAKAEELYGKAARCGYTVAEKPLKRVRNKIERANNADKKKGRFARYD